MVDESSPIGDSVGGARADACSGAPGESLDDSRSESFGDDLRLGSVAPSLVVRGLSALEVHRLVWEGVTLVDARSSREYQHWHLRQAIPLPGDGLPESGGDAACLKASLLRSSFPDRRTPLIVYSKGDRRSHQLVKRLQELGYLHVYALAGGLSQVLALQDI